MRRLFNFIQITVIAGVAIAFVGFEFIERLPEYAGSLPGATAKQTITGEVTRVRDGDTIEVAGLPIRLGSLNCAERGSLRGDTATKRMKVLVYRETLTCYLNGRTSYDRSIGSCALSDGRDIGAVMIQEGLCRRYF
ncbi:MAG: endonuclease YncB(thermonuclease family) [Halocynthiibacter sp.]|jgi:endonuclease YncB( thermonuclease family)